jgi:hypothetical protein
MSSIGQMFKLLFYDMGPLFTQAAFIRILSRMFPLPLRVPPELYEHVNMHSTTEDKRPKRCK